MFKLFFLLAALSITPPAATFEPEDFDVSQALLSHGLEIANIQHLSNSVGGNPCATACATLASHYGDDRVLAANGTAYTTFRDGYWSAIQSDVYPYCIFEPPNADALSVLVLLSRMTQCPWALKSGGHSAFNGASSIEGGITVSFQNMNSIVLSADKKIASVEPGNNWATVYAKLAEDEVTAIGGRVARIGVGGLTLGGGISFFSGKHGWACDNVEAYEVITACGQRINVTVDSYPDLYWALRGGGNNFGIVTKFHLQTVPIPGNVIWAGTRTYLENNFAALVDGFSDLAIKTEEDPQAGQWTAFGSLNGTRFGATTFWYSNPANITNTHVFDNINQVPFIANDTQTRNLVEFVESTQNSNPYGFREVYYAMSTKVSPELANFAIETFYDALPSVASVNGSFPILLFQAITVPQIMNMAQRGGNPLGLKPEDGPLYLYSMPTWWDNAADDATIYAFVSGIFTKISDKAKTMGLQSEYIYMNYASKFQDVIRGYGAENKARLIEIARKYDPQRVFQTLQPGYFKLDGPPEESGYFSGSWD